MAGFAEAGYLIDEERERRKALEAIARIRRSMALQDKPLPVPGSAIPGREGEFNPSAQLGASLTTPEGRAEYRTKVGDTVSPQTQGKSLMDLADEADPLGELTGNETYQRALAQLGMKKFNQAAPSLKNAQVDPMAMEAPSMGDVQKSAEGEVMRETYESPRGLARNLGLAGNTSDAAKQFMSEINKEDTDSYRSAQIDSMKQRGAYLKWQMENAKTPEEKRQLQMEYDQWKANLGLETGEDMASRTTLARIGAEKSSGETGRSDATKLRTEYNTLSKDFVKIRDSYQRITGSAKDSSAAGDLAIIFNYMKILDPGSVVRESEFATAQNAAGIPERIRAQYNNALRGERLAPKTRADFINQARILYTGQRDIQKNLSTRYKELARAYRLDPFLVVDESLLSAPVEGDRTDRPRPDSYTSPVGPASSGRTPEEEREYQELKAQFGE